jgi:hypothetical protein
LSPPSQVFLWFALLETSGVGLLAAAQLDRSNDGSWPFSNLDEGQLLLMLKDRTG